MKQNGRKQAMTNTFIRLGTRPEQYSPFYKSCSYGEVSHCDLCGAALEYHFKLVHVDDADFSKNLSLNVGSDCIYNFIQTYMPGIIDQILSSIEDAVNNARNKKFKETYPSIFEDARALKENLNKIERKHGYHPGRFLERYINFQKNFRDLIRKEYLSTPKVSKLYEFKKEIDDGAWEEKVVNHINLIKNYKKDQDSIKKDKKNDKSFYKKYYFFYNLLNYQTFNEEARKLSDLEKELFLEKVNIRLSNREKLKLRFINEVTAHPKIYTALWNASKKDLDKLNLLYHFYLTFNYQALNSYQLKTVSKLLLNNEAEADIIYKGKISNIYKKVASNYKKEIKNLL